MDRAKLINLLTEKITKQGVIHDNAYKYAESIVNILPEKVLEDKSVLRIYIKDIGNALLNSLDEIVNPQP